MRRFTLATTMLAASATALLASDALPPEFGNSAFHASIKSAGDVADVDEYAATLVRGEALSVTVRADKRTTLQPRVTFVDPSGLEMTPPMLPKSGGPFAATAAFPVPATGLWTVRVADVGAGEGGYVAAFKIAPQPPLRGEAVVDGEGVEFEALDGALLDVKLTWTDKAAPVFISSIETPTEPATGGRASSSKKSLTLKGVVLAGGTGTHRLRLSSPAVGATCRYEIKLRAKGRPAGKRPVQLSADEPTIDPVVSPVRVTAGGVVQIAGVNFKDSDTVYFGTVPAFATASTDGRSLSAVAPTGILAGTIVDLVVVSADGQIARAADYFEYAAQ